jgi:hypothetical protein
MLARCNPVIRCSQAYLVADLKELTFCVSVDLPVDSYALISKLFYIFAIYSIEYLRIL